MITPFIAVQCFECSTMQVKQQKKSSNKWSCVVCNQKQSVRKVFARAFMAKDVRIFVQNFNMSRQLSDQKQLDTEELETFDPPKDEEKRKRNDWTQYVDDQDEYCEKLEKNVDRREGDSEVEAMIVTEMPNSLFRKPKVKDYSFHGNEQLRKPIFPNRSYANRLQNDHTQDINKRASKRSASYVIRDEDNHSMALHHHPSSDRKSLRIKIQDDHRSSSDEPSVYQPRKEVKKKNDEHNAAAIERGGTHRLHHLTTAKGTTAVSKWSSFITEEDEDNLESRGGRKNIYPLEEESSANDEEKVEDDIHPDFL